MKVGYLLAVANAALALAAPPVVKRQDTTTSSTSTTPATTSTTTSAAATGTPCAGNTAADRSVWCDRNINTDYYNDVPDTGVIREYWLNLQQETLAPDGFPRTVYTVNGTVPGPTLIGDWGDTFVVHVTNNLAESKNGTSIHFHGIRQNYTNQDDGVTSITQCPTAPGDTYTYTWRATQYGHTWYHSHIGLQAWMGVAGGIIINGPTSANYEEDKGVIFLTDWSHQTVDELYIQAQLTGPPHLDNGLINGTNVFGNDGDAAQTGSRFSTTFQPGSTNRLRLINSAIDTHYKFSIDNHTLTVVAMDLVPIVPFTTQVLDIAIAQRYDVIVNADQAAVASDFWLRAVPQVACSNTGQVDNIKGIVHYGTSTGTPTTSAYAYVDGCVDEPPASLVPVVQKNADAADLTTIEQVTVGRNTQNFFRWFLNGTTFLSRWEDPTLLQVYNNDTTFMQSENVIRLPNAGEWAYVVVESALGIPHPIHLHGHDFLMLAQGTGAFDATTPLNLVNPVRRDVAMLPPAGHLVLAFETDNPGAWLMHCHIGWHTDEGFALQFLEREAEIRPLIDPVELNETCDAWDAWVAAQGVEQEDSGV